MKTDTLVNVLLGLALISVGLSNALNHLIGILRQDTLGGHILFVFFFVGAVALVVFGALMVKGEIRVEWKEEIRGVEKCL